MERYLSLKDHVYNYLSDRINTGDLRPGDRVSEPQVSEELGVSRTPVREALIQLSSDGYLENLPRKGFRVKSLDVEKACGLYEIIGILDGRAAASCVGLLDEKDFRSMQELIVEMDQAIENNDGKKYYETQVKFHNVYLDKCPNQQIPELLTQLKKNFIRKYYVFDEAENEIEVLCSTNRQHAVILALLRNENGTEVERFIRDVHWSASKAQFDSLE